MNDRVRQEMTQILLGLHEDRVGRRAAADRLFEVAYDELHRLASDLMRAERRGHTLQSTALVHEAYLRLVDDSKVAWQSRAHFFGIVARVMRQILVDQARGRAAAKRGGGWQRVTLDEALGLESPSEVEILHLESALERLYQTDERMGRIVELRVFGGLSMVEIAHVLELSRQTVQDDWRVARMWLVRELAEGNPT